MEARAPEKEDSKKSILPNHTFARKKEERTIFVFLIFNPCFTTPYEYMLKDIYITI
jgi:hypothetical protein